MTIPEARCHAFVAGVVQGVGFRYFVMDAAVDVAAVGGVSNLRDGRDELTARGAPRRGCPAPAWARVPALRAGGGGEGGGRFFRSLLGADPFGQDLHRFPAKRLAFTRLEDFRAGPN